MTKPARAGAREWLLLLVSSVVAFIGCEFAVREFLLGDEAGWSMVPPVEMRVRDAKEEPQGRFRVLVLGDSQTEWRDTTGHSYVRVAERKLSQTGVSVQMINLAQAGTDLDCYFGNLITYADRLKPDLVVVGLYLGNDLYPATSPLDTPEGKVAAKRTVKGPGGDRSVWVRTAKKSAFLTYVYLRGKRYLRQLRPQSFEQFVATVSESDDRDDLYVKKRLQELDPTMVDAARAEVINPALLVQGILLPDYYGDLAAVRPNSHMASKVQGALRDLAAVVAFCHERRLPVAVVLIPPPVWVSERYHDFFHRLGYRNLGPVSEPVPVVEQLKKAFTALQVPVVDLLPVLRAEHDVTYLVNDEHLNRRGHELVGAELARVLVSSGLLAPSAK
jgi:hypothetical protein